MTLTIEAACTLGPVKGMLNRLGRYCDWIPQDVLRAELEALEISAADLSPYLRFGAEHYAKRLLRLTRTCEAWLVTWRAGQCTVVHDHGASAAAFKVIHGVATELRFGRSPGGYLYPVASRRIEAGTTVSDSDELVHQVCNLEPPGHDLIGIHLYSPPLSETATFSLNETPFAGHDGLREQLRVEPTPAAAEVPLLPV